MNKVLFSSLSENWRTPKGIYDKLNTEFHFNDDPCPINGADGLVREWKSRPFLNPPYSMIKEFLRKWMIEWATGRLEICVFLIPSRTDTKWFHEIVLPNAKEIRFLKGRLHFNESKNSAPFPSMIVVFK